jgi:ribosomal protein S18 acetylase RimI-like enzyme
MLAHRENLKRIVLGVWNFNIHAIEFYKGQGFRCFEERMEHDLL